MEYEEICVDVSVKCGYDVGGYLRVIGHACHTTAVLI